MGSPALVAGGDALRSHRGRLFDPEHGVDQRAARVGEPAFRWDVGLGWNPKTEARETRTPDSSFRLFSTESKAAQDFRGVPRSAVCWIVRQVFCAAYDPAARTVAWFERRGPGDCRFHPSVCGESSCLRS